MSGPRTIVAGGTLATADGTLTADLVIDGGRVAAIADPGCGGDADELIDASGLIVMPGAIYGEGYRQLGSHCFAYIHATEVGGTHPALIEAMGRVQVPG